jgi:hypothetical protein
LNWATYNTVKYPKFDGNSVPGPLPAQSSENFTPLISKEFDTPENNKSTGNSTYYGPEYTVN